MPKRLALEIAFVLGAKIAALCLLYVLFFTGDAPVDAAAHLMGG